MNISAKDLRKHVKDVLAATDNGEEVVITYRGLPRAKMVSFKAARKVKPKTQDSALFGIWSDRDSLSPKEYVGSLRKNRYSL